MQTKNNLKLLDIFIFHVAQSLYFKNEWVIIQITHLSMTIDWRFPTCCLDVEENRWSCFMVQTRKCSNCSQYWINFELTDRIAGVDRVPDLTSVVWKIKVIVTKQKNFTYYFFTLNLTQLKQPFWKTRTLSHGIWLKLFWKR